ncbi:Ribonuclease 3 [Acholeplasma oculi]|uniref:Ribonuclease 3 n=1 Tax=Acholeplasma oculi TaxID=35623 RepID=A0A061AJY3_9MOLU|nr:ribonuclease III [Acholeplasma oculi]CDR31307.1 rNase3 domain protein [Acholeplasma oculi]SKC38905.1 RNAse III [Acholeplasma oculi]SUT91561.1 Ribonuclease 3 [Acholeplasma oculi]
MNELFEKLNIKPKQIKLYEMALTHTSYAHENQVDHNERLEFLGDAVIEILMSDYLYHKDQRDQGVLTKKRAQSVREEALYLYACEIDLPKYMKLGNGETEAKQSMVADAFEALFAAIYIDLGLEVTREVFNRLVIPHLKLVESIKDYKTQLQEMIQLERKSITYKTVKVGGPSHKPIFRSEVHLEDSILLGIGMGSSTKEAEQNAAREALSKVVKGASNDSKVI